MPIASLTDFSTANFPLIITCADGLESALLIELHGLGVSGEMIRAGRISAAVDLTKFYQLCLYSRVASRILLPLGEFHFQQKTEQGKEVLDDDVPAALYDFARRIDWTTLFSVDDSFAIRLSTDKRLSVNQQFATLRIKDAVADTFNEALGARPDVDAKSPDFQLFVSANPKHAEFYLDLSGASLHRRGYRVMNTAAPLKENLASALLYECGWHDTPFDAIIDPMCGSGTFIIEALLMRTEYPVGLEKADNDFGFYAWQHHDETLWRQMVDEATHNFHDKLDALTKNPITVIAMDADEEAVTACRRNIMASGLIDLLPAITLKQRAANHLSDALSGIDAKYPLLICNPPYGERLGDLDFLKPLYQGLGLLAVDGLNRAGITQANIAILASQVEHADTLPVKDPKTLRCHNGALTVYFRHGQLNLAPLPSLIRDFERQDITQDEAQEFINRLQKNLVALKRIALKTGVTNLRVYDADLPNFNVAIDIYGDKVHVQEYAPPKQIPADVARFRFNLVLATLREVLGVSRESIFIKTRARQSGNDQYTKNESSAKAKKMFVAAEDNAYLYVNFTDYLDTGLFIDHRNMRKRIKEASRGKRVLNLFAYTCTASVQAALGGAIHVTSVDLSANYLDWGKKNFALNGLVLDATYDDGVYEDAPRYEFVAADTFEWIKQNTAQFDMIFIDPPTFSNSKKFYGTFDVQRDHVALINRAMNRLAAGGVLYFSNNFTRFILDENLAQRYDVTVITHETIGFDFDMKKPIHQSFEIRHKAGVRTVASDVDFGEETAQRNNRAHSRDGKRFERDSHERNHSRDDAKRFHRDERNNRFSRDDEGTKADKPLGKWQQKKADAKALKEARERKAAKGAKGSGAWDNKNRFIGEKAQSKSEGAGVKRVYVNPKLANRDEVAQRLNDAVEKQQAAEARAAAREADNQSKPKKYQIKAKD